MKQFGCYEVTGEVKNKPKVIDGGHMFFYIQDESGEIECGAYEPTKSFRNIVSDLPFASPSANPSSFPCR